MNPSELDKVNGKYVDEWVPEVGQWVEGAAESGVTFKCLIIAVFQGSYPEARAIVFQYEDGGIEAATESNGYTFAPIKSEAEKLRDEQVLQIIDVMQNTIADSIQDRANVYYSRGIRITRELTECAIEKIVAMATKGAPETLYHYEKQAARIAAAYVRGELEL